MNDLRFTSSFVHCSYIDFNRVIERLLGWRHFPIITNSVHFGTANAVVGNSNFGTIGSANSGRTVQKVARLDLKAPFPGTFYHM